MLGISDGWYHKVYELRSVLKPGGTIESLDPLSCLVVQFANPQELHSRIGGDKLLAYSEHSELGRAWVASVVVDSIPGPQTDVAEY